jgi:predicted ester cyclase
MNQTQKNKQFFFKYHTALSGKKKTRELISQFVEDEKLVHHILFFEELFPAYAVEIDELVAEGDRVFVRSHMTGIHEGSMEGIPATHRHVDTPFALGYKIEGEKIVDFWAIANEMEFFRQLGLTQDQVNVPQEKA